MPSWVNTTLTFDNEIDVGEFEHEFGSGYRCIDFNEIIPMPKSLQTGNDPGYDYKMKLMVAEMHESGEPKDQVINLLSDYMNSSECRGFIQIRGLDQHPDAIDLYAGKIYLDAVADLSKIIAEDDDTFIDGIQGQRKVFLQNFKKYGHTSWYSWCVANWGTKWNADATSIDDEEGWIEFTTAWSDVSKLLLVAHQKLPDIPFRMRAESEDGDITTAEFKDGKMHNHKKS